VKKRLLVITKPSLFGTGIIRLLQKQTEQLEIKIVPDIKTALEIGDLFHPDVVVYFKEPGVSGEEAHSRDLMSRYPTRVIQCTLEANQLTIFDRTRIQNATVEDLLTAVLN
jgi:hypothetical protein